MIRKRHRLVLLIILVLGSSYLLIYLFLSLQSDTQTELLNYRFKPMTLVKDRVEYVNMQSSSIRSEVTFVSAVYEIFTIGQSVDIYFKSLEKTLLLKAPFVIFTESKSINAIKKMIPPEKKAVLVSIELDELPFLVHAYLVNEVIIDKEFQRKIKYPDRPEYNNPLYPVLVFSKFEFLNVTANVLNPFKSSKFVWLDSTVSLFYSGFEMSKEFTCRHIPDKLLTVAFDNKAFDNPDFRSKNYTNLIFSERSFVHSKIMAIGSARLASVVYEKIKRQWLEMLKQKVVYNDRTAVEILSLRRPDLFNLYVKKSHENWTDMLELLV